MNKKILVLAALSLCACEQKTTVVLIRDGQMKTSAVGKIGPRCWVSWYDGIEKLELRRDGTAVDPPMQYRWTLERSGPDDRAADEKWFDANCYDPFGVKRNG